MIRSIFSVTIGYGLFMIAATLFFQLSDKDPHRTQALGYVIAATLCGVASALLSGYCTACIANQEGLRYSIVLALMIAIMAIFSLVVNIGKGSLWAELTTFVLICPAAILGGYLREKQRVKKSKIQISKIR